ncbi:MAG TPA: glycosyltransferase family 4 protein [Acidimicrobiales bacterium]|nr:glycosyltransferase family 4 protein [Acidimicrobiales bacterium]
MTATRTKRILSIQPVAERGGSDRALVRLVRSLAQDGWDCHIAAPSWPPTYADLHAAGATIHLVPMPRITSGGSLGYWAAYLAAWPLAVLRLVRLGRRLNVTVVHSNSLHSWYGWAAAAVLRRPHVWHAREIVVQSAAALRLEQFLARHFATTVIAVSQAVAAQLPGAPVVVEYDEPDPSEFFPGKGGRFRRPAGIPDHVPLVGTVGRVDTWKGIDTLLDAVGHLQAGRPDVQVVIAGGTVAGKEEFARGLEKRAAALSGVHWLGERADASEVIADLDVLVLASTEPEPFGLAVVEALASGVPVVATAAGGPLEILGAAPAGAGRLVAPRQPEALAAAVLELLPPGPSSAARRQARPVLRTPGAAGGLAAVFDRLLSEPQRRGRGPRSRRRSGAS